MRPQQHPAAPPHSDASPHCILPHPHTRMRPHTAPCRAPTLGYAPKLHPAAPPHLRSSIRRSCCRSLTPAASSSRRAARAASSRAPRSSHSSTPRCGRCSRQYTHTRSTSRRFATSGGTTWRCRTRLQRCGRGVVWRGVRRVAWVVVGGYDHVA
eukprot:133540-Chlamydomonas_euryale.AAC.1